MASIQDWAAKAARYIVTEGFVKMGDRSNLQREERVAAIIATFAEPLVKLLQESRREHYHCEDRRCCPKRDADCGGYADRELCNCGADEWNRKVEEALK